MTPLFKNFSTYLLGNLIVLVLGTFKLLMIPKLLSVSEYGLYSTFVLFLSYTSLLHLGLKDGVYVYLCGQQEPKKKENDEFFTVIFYQQLIISLLVILLSFIFSSYKFLLTALGIMTFFNILITYLDSYYLAFDFYKPVVRFRVLREFSILTILMFLFIYSSIKVDFKSIISITVIVNVIGAFLYFYYKYPRYRLVKLSKSFVPKLREVYKRGIKILIGNFGHQFNTNIDKLFVATLYSSKIFGYYSFGSLIFILTNLLSTSISQVLLPHHSLSNFEDKVKQYKKLSTLTFCILLPTYLGYFILFYFIQRFYKDFIPSIIVIKFLALGIFYNFKISLIQNNFMKVLKLDNKYIWNNYLPLLFFLISIFIIKFYDLNYSWFAFATSVSIFFKYILNIIEINKVLKADKLIKVIIRNVLHLFIYYALFFLI